METFAQQNYKHVFETTRDDLGRPLTANLSRNRELVPNRLPEREGLPTDARAFSEFTKNKPEVLSLIKYLRSLSREKELIPSEVESLSFILSGLPLYLAMRKNNPVTTIPSVFIDAARAADGIRIVTAHIGFYLNNDKYHTSDQIYNTANSKKKNFFISHDESASCPAPESTVKEVLDTMIEYPKEEIDPSSHSWGHEIPDREEAKRVIQFGLIYKRTTYASEALAEDRNNVEFQNNLTECWNDMDHVLERA